MPPGPNLGAELVEASSSEEVIQAVQMINVLFSGDPEGREAYINRFFGPGVLPSQQEYPASQLLTLPGAVPDIAGFLVSVNKCPSDGSVLHALGEKLEQFFEHGPGAAATMFEKLRINLIASSCRTTGQPIIVRISGREEGGRAWLWKSCKMAATLALIFAAPNETEKLFAALQCQSRLLGGFVDYETITNTPSASLLAEFGSAKRAALDEGKTTVMGVTLVDVHIFELAERNAADPYFSFAHVFVLGVGPEGIRVWQSWGKHGYRLDEYLEQGHARLRDWNEADKFVGDFEKLVVRKGPWSAKINKLYKRLFNVDVNAICGPRGPERPVTPKFQGWVRIHRIDNVTVENLKKFVWVKEGQ